MKYGFWRSYELYEKKVAPDFTKWFASQNDAFKFCEDQGIEWVFDSVMI